MLQIYQEKEVREISKRSPNPIPRRIYELIFDKIIIIIMIFLSLTVIHRRINTIEIKMNEEKNWRLHCEDENGCHLLSKMEAVSKLCGIKGIKHRINVLDHTTERIKKGQFNVKHCHCHKIGHMVIWFNK